jgi:hypothetical protein
MGWTLNLMALVFELINYANDHLCLFCVAMWVYCGLLIEWMHVRGAPLPVLMCSCELVMSGDLLCIFLAGTGDPFVPANPMGMGLGQLLNPSRVVGFFTGKTCTRGHGFRLAKPSGFVPVAIPTHNLKFHYSSSFYTLHSLYAHGPMHHSPITSHHFFKFPLFTHLILRSKQVLVLRRRQKKTSFASCMWKHF